MINLTPIFRHWASWQVRSLRTADPVERQRRVLRRLLARGASSRFGRDHGFEGIASVEAYQEQVGLRDYDTFWREYWEEPFPNLIDATWPGKVPFFAVSSGTSTGRTKYLPLTQPMIDQQRRAGFGTLAAHIAAHPQSRPLGGKTFMLGGSTALVDEAPGVRSGDLSGILAFVAPAYIRPLIFPPLDIALIADWEQKLDRLVEAIDGEPIHVLGGIPSWLLILFDRLEHRYDQWPLSNVELLVHGGVHWGPYERRFQPYLERTGAVTREVYSASEGFVAYADAAPADGMMLCYGDGIFYEFVPVDELGTANPTRHWLDTIEPGVNYAVILTTAAGLWSYILGDTVSFLSRRPPRLVVTGRTAFMLSVFGEHLIETELEQAVIEAAEGSGIHVTDFMAGAQLPDASGELGHHVFLIEPATPADPAIAVAMGSAIDRALSRLNDDYAAHRSGGTGLDGPRVEFLQPGRFAEWMRSRGKLGGQHKVPRVLADPERFAEARRELVSFELSDAPTVEA